MDGAVCIFVPVVLWLGASSTDVQLAASMVRAARETWATPNTIFVLPAKEEEAPGLSSQLPPVQLSRLPRFLAGLKAVKSATLLTGFLVWKHALSFMQMAGSRCSWAMKLPLHSYLNAPALERRLACFNASARWYLGATTAVYAAGAEPFMFPNIIGGAILSRGIFNHASAWASYCLDHWDAEEEDGTEPQQGFLEDYAFALCLNDLGRTQGKNFADIETSFIMMERPGRTMEVFRDHPDTVKQCLLVVGTLGTAEDVHTVHARLTWSNWHRSIPCVGESSFGAHTISDALGNERPYYDEEIRLAIYYCKDARMVELERSLSHALAHRNPRDGRGDPGYRERAATAAADRHHLCIFVPSSARQPRFVQAAEAAWRAWGTRTTYFVSTAYLSPLLDPQTLRFDLDIDTDYARLPVRTFRLFESLGRRGWASACDWYMKADADSFLNVPLLEERLRCFDPDEFWFLGVPQVAHGSQGSTTRFASGGAGYVVSRGLLPKVAAWAPFCLLQLLQHSGGTGMEDVSFAGCLSKWGHIRAASYLDAEREVITSEAQQNRTRVTEPRPPGLPINETSMPPCTFVVHSIAPEELPIVRTNVVEAWAASGFDACRPDAQKLRDDARMLLAPVEETRFTEVPQWRVYEDRELKALLACSREARSATR